MKIPLSWLKEIITINRPLKQLEEDLTLLGLEVEGMEPLPLTFEGVVVGEVMSTEAHPEAEKLCVAQVSDGVETVQVVCGASNCRAGLKTAFAKVGSKLGLNEEKPLKIKRAKLRGVESFGMLCAAVELGLGEEDGGIMELSGDLTAGTPLSELYGDTILELGLTPNLGHCNSMLGVARELAALYELPLNLPTPSVGEAAIPMGDRTSVTVHTPEGCPRYAARMITGVKVGPSPDWLRHKVEGCGMRSINCVVDITNLVMMELGHPLHAFDYDQLEEGRIEVRLSQPGETFVTLDEVERTLPEDSVLICDGKRPVAIGGVMGGLNSEVTDRTTTILLEAAYFDPMVVRRTSKKLGLSTESSRRFERGTDPNGLQRALDRAISLFQELAGGEILQGTLDIASQEFPAWPLSCRVEETNRFLGTALSGPEMEAILSGLELQATFDGENTVNCTIPTYRNDLKIEVDLMEEIARHYGYANIPRTPPKFSTSPLPHSASYLFEKQIRHRLVGEGLQELLTCDLIGPSLLSLLHEKVLTGRALIRVNNPTSIEQSILRPSLLPGLLQVAKYNFDHQNPNLAAFEVGHIHFRVDSEERNGYRELPMVGVVLSGTATPPHWDGADREVDFFDLKGLLENLLLSLGITADRTEYAPSSHDNFHPGRQANLLIDGRDIGVLGEIHPQTQRQLDTPQRLYFAELDLTALYALQNRGEKMKPLPIFPGSERDWTLTVKHSLPADQVLRAVSGVPSKLLKDFSVVSLYESEKLGSDRKNVTLNFVYRNDKKTLSQEAVDKEHERLMNGVLAKLGESVLSS